MDFSNVDITTQGPEAGILEIYLRELSDRIGQFTEQKSTGVAIKAQPGPSAYIRDAAHIMARRARYVELSVAGNTDYLVLGLHGFTTGSEDWILG